VRKKEIFDLFIDRACAKNMINIDEDVILKITNDIVDGDFKLELFDDAEKCVLSLMEKDSLLKFLRSEEFLSVVYLYEREDVIRFVPELHYFTFINNCVNERDWVLYTTKKYTNIYLKSKNELKMKTIGIINGHVADIASVVMGLEKNRRKWDINYYEGATIESITDEIDIVHMVMKPMLFSEKKRDFLLMRTNKTLDDGSFVSTCMSIDYSDRFIIKKGHVLTKLITSGWYIRPLEDNPNSSLVYNIINLEYLGKVNNALRNVLIKERVQLISRLRKIVKNIILEKGEEIEKGESSYPHIDKYVPTLVDRVGEMQMHRSSSYVDVNKYRLKEKKRSTYLLQSNLD